MMGIFGPYSPFLVGGSGLSFRGGGSELLQGGGSLWDPSGGGALALPMSMYALNGRLKAVYLAYE